MDITDQQFPNISCSVGNIHNDVCHKTVFTRTLGLKRLQELTDREKELLYWRVGCALSDMTNTDFTVCRHHEQMYLLRYESKQTACCDPFSKHADTVKASLRVITLQLAKHLKPLGLDIKPGQKLCIKCRILCTDMTERACSKRALLDSPQKSCVDSTESVTELTRNEDRTCLNTSLTNLGCTPIKLHSLSSHSKRSYMKRKMSQMKGSMKVKMSSVIGLEEQEVQCLSSTDSEQDEAEALQKKASDMDDIVESINRKIPEVSNQHKVQLLTIVPLSWSRNEVAQTFGVSEYLVREAQKLRKEVGICSMRAPYKGKLLNEFTISLITAFYQDDEYSRQLPGIKDKVSISRNVYMQKRLVLCNLKELYAAFKMKYGNEKVGFSKFCSLRPKWCVLAGSSGTHSICVCMIHQNVELIIQGLGIKDTNSELMKRFVCDTENRDCMLKRCNNCPSIETVKEYLSQKCTYSEDDMVVYSQWISVDRTELVSLQLSFGELADKLITQMQVLIPHAYIAKAQSKYFKSRKENLANETEAIVVLDFAENFSFVMQDEVQGYHWNKSMCTLHPAIVYYKLDGLIMSFSMCVLSDDLEHDVPFVHEVQHQLVSLLKSKLPKLTQIEYNSDGCAAQYKNCKNFLNLCHHQSDFGIRAAWSFFATSHGKSACDGIGGTVKRLTARASLQRPYNDQITSPVQMYEFCSKEISGIHFVFIKHEDMVHIRSDQEKRFSFTKTIAGTRSFHFFSPQNDHTLSMKRISKDEHYALNFTFSTNNISMPEHVPNTYVCAIYDRKWYVGIVVEIKTDMGDALVKFMQPAGPSRSFTWPEKDDNCWIPFQHILCCIPVPCTTSGHQYQLSEATTQLIQRKWLDLQV